LSFTSAKCVSCLSAKSLDHGGQEASGCVPVTIMDLSCLAFIMKAWSKALQMLYKVWILGVGFKALYIVY
jgi:hypothetical protein